MSYKIIRHYFDDSIPKKIIDSGLTLEEAQAHCQRDDTSSKTGGVDPATNQPWFDGYTEE